MPGRDTTGPFGRGTRIGRGLGDCNLEDPFATDMSVPSACGENFRSLTELLEDLELISLENLSILERSDVHINQGIAENPDASLAERLRMMAERLVSINERIQRVIKEL